MASALISVGRAAVKRSVRTGPQRWARFEPSIAAQQTTMFSLRSFGGYGPAHPQTAEHTGGQGNVHRSNAEELIAQQDVIVVHGNVALCDGGGGSLGHPLEYIQLDKVNREEPAVCKYCGLRFVMAPGHH